LHGLFGSGSNWRSVARELAARIRCTASTCATTAHRRGPIRWTTTRWPDDVLQLIERLKLRSADADGPQHGRQGRDGAGAASPGRIGGLIVVDIAPVSYADTLTPFAEAMRGADVMAAASRAEVQRRLQQTAPDPEVVPFLMQNLVARNDHFDWR
jgi:pimeloyl-ACP methyl ester carboxylesterase